MPKKKTYAPFTAEEKKAILERHKKLVEEMNAALPPEMAVAIDPDLEKRLDDPATVGIYRIGQEMEAIMQRQMEIYEKLKKDIGVMPKEKENPMGRSFHLCLDPNNTPEAKAYNEKIYRDYLENPGKILHYRYNKLINIDPKAIYDCNDDPLKLAEYYRDTYPQCEEGFNFSSVIGNSNSKTADMKAAVTSLTGPMEALSFPCTMVRGAQGIDYFACPKLTIEQAAIVMQSCRDLVANSESLRLTVTDAMVGATNKPPHQYFDQFVQRGIPLKKGMFVENRPETYELDENGKQINQRETSYQALFDAGENDHVQFAPRTGNNLIQVQAMNRSFLQQYQNKWQQVFNQKRGYVGEFDLNQIEKQHQGGFFERNIKHSTSAEYKGFLQALKDYHDPKSPNFMNSVNLIDKGSAYLQHKADQGYEKIEDMSGTSLIRARLVKAAIDACAEVDPQAVGQEWLRDYEVHAQREPFLKEEDVSEEMDIKGLSDEMALDMSKDVDLDMTY